MKENQLIYGEKDRPILIAAYRSQLQEVEAQLREYEIEKNRIINLLKQLGGVSAPFSKPLREGARSKRSRTFRIPDLASLGPGGERLAEYDPNWKWEDRINYALNELKVISQKSEIFDKMVEFDPALVATDDDRIGSSKSVGATLSRLAKPGKTYGKIEKEGSRAYYGLSEWFNEDGTVKSEYQVQEEDLSYGTDETIDLF